MDQTTEQQDDALSFDPFDGDFGDRETRVVDAIVDAPAPIRCHVCAGPIHAGTKVRRIVETRADLEGMPAEDAGVVTAADMAEYERTRTEFLICSTCCDAARNDAVDERGDGRRLERRYGVGERRRIMAEPLDTGSLSRTQRKILLLMRTHGPASFAGGTRTFGYRVTENGVLIQAYQAPELFLCRRGLIRTAPMNAPGRWYRLTEQGEARAARLVDPSARRGGRGYVPPAVPDEGAILAALRHAVDQDDPALARYPAAPETIAAIRRGWQLRGWIRLQRFTGHGRAAAARMVEVQGERG
ncbi:hypothetical protein J2847_006448 [Azospirillum agricola]|uniref:hypothetical protein n=1 Tax=Azospirillum agricola TaxID=1720247 RepID=UPI001AE751A0|nr:hypothetical protein [Azospirillum agricola]MBP2233113.1 hypothetical protein [Azospirillum agricola]